MVCIQSWNAYAKKWSRSLSPVRLSVSFDVLEMWNGHMYIQVLPGRFESIGTFQYCINFLWMVHGMNTNWMQFLAFTKCIDLPACLPVYKHNIERFSNPRMETNQRKSRLRPFLFHARECHAWKWQRKEWLGIIVNMSDEYDLLIFVLLDTPGMKQNFEVIFCGIGASEKTI